MTAARVLDCDVPSRCAVNCMAVVGHLGAASASGPLDASHSPGTHFTLDFQILEFCLYLRHKSTFQATQAGKCCWRWILFYGSSVFL